MSCHNRSAAPANRCRGPFPSIRALETARRGTLSSVRQRASKRPMHVGWATSCLSVHWAVVEGSTFATCSDKFFTSWLLVQLLLFSSFVPSGNLSQRRRLDQRAPRRTDSQTRGALSFPVRKTGHLRRLLLEPTTNNVLGPLPYYA